MGIARKQTIAELYLGTAISLYVHVGYIDIAFFLSEFAVGNIDSPSAQFLSQSIETG